MARRSRDRRDRVHPGFEALIGTPDLEAGQPSLITSTDRLVNGSGYSGPATPEFEATFEHAFGA